MAPPALQHEMFGLYALSGKATAFIGPLLAGWITEWAGTQRAGMASIIMLFVIGFLIMLTVNTAQISSQNSTAHPRTQIPSDQSL
jgi:UMF1 family MFS transporter